MTTHMAREARETPAVVARQIAEGLPIYRDLGHRLRALAPRVALTGARGSSDAAAVYFKYLAEIAVGVPVASIGPSVASVYRATLHAPGAACVTISQSGASPDLVALQRAAQAGGAFTAAVLNVTDSPVGREAQAVVPVFAGPERAVAATKTCVASFVAVAAVVAAWADDAALWDAIGRLPDALASAVALDWTAAVEAFGGAGPVFVVGRGPGLAVAAEAVLKLKEACGLHAEAVSAAELLHGPVALARPGLRALVFGARDAGDPSLRQAVDILRAAGARALHAGFMAGDRDPLPTTAAPHPLLDPILHLAATHVFAARLAEARGLNPDAPPLLRKITETL